MGRQPAGKRGTARRGVAVGACVVSAVPVVVAIILAILAGVCVFAIQKIRPGWLRIQAGAGQRFNFSIEMGQGGDRPPREERRELEAGRDQPELEAGPSSSAPSGAADQDNAAA
jgi:hypothetical protein